MAGSSAGTTAFDEKVNSTEPLTSCGNGVAIVIAIVPCCPGVSGEKTNPGEGMTTVVASDEVLFATFKSPSTETETMWFTRPAAPPFTETLIWYVVESFGGRPLEFAQTTEAPAAEHDQPVPE